MNRFIKSNPCVFPSFYGGMILIGAFLHLYCPICTPAHPLDDNAWYQWSGWYISQGARPYVDIWEAKFPFVGLELTTLVSHFFGNNLYATHVFYMTFMALIYLGIFVGMTLLIWIITDNIKGAILTGLLLLTYHYLPILTVMGIRPKIVMIALALYSLILMEMDFYFLSGILAGLAGGSWQFGIIFPIIILLDGWFAKNKTKYFLNGIGGILLASFIVVVPIIYWNSLESMITLTLIVPLAVPGNQNFTFLSTIFELSWIIPFLIPIGLFSSTWVSLKSNYKAWWIPFGIVIFLIQVFFIDYDGAADLIPLIVFSCLGLGLGSNLLSKKKIQFLIVFLIFIIPLFYSPVLAPNDHFDVKRIFATLYKGHLKIGPTKQQMERSDQVGRQNGLDDKFLFSDYYWFRYKPSNCHLRMSPPQRQWLKLTGRSANNPRCGQLPSWDTLQKIF